ncbi:MAG: NifB/NifX family molybdenum-iron cluster-binding protein [Thermodesulfobacteriota bacterium]
MKSLIFSVLVACCLVAGLAHSGEKVRVAVASEGNNVNAQLSEVAAKSPYFLIFDEAGSMMEALENPYRNTRRGAGRSIVPFLAQRGVTFVVAGKFGQNMIQGMESQGIKYLAFKGGIEEALEKVLEVVK